MLINKISREDLKNRYGKIKDVDVTTYRETLPNDIDLAPVISLLYQIYVAN